MRRFSCLLGTLALITALGPAAAQASDGHDHAPDRINLPDGWQPEGITTDGDALYAGSLANGAIFKASPRTGQGFVLAQGKAGRVAVGLDYDRRRDLLWAAGGGTNVVRVYDADTGKVVARYDFPSATPRFFNDLVVTRDAVYVTDSFNQELGVIPLRNEDDDRSARRGDDDSEDGLPPKSAATTLPLTGDLVDEVGFNLNGIVSDHHHLIAVQSNTGLLFRINPRTGETSTLDLGGVLLKGGDGLERDDETLYVVNNGNHVDVVELNDHGSSGEVLSPPLTADSLDVSSTAALARGSLWVVNARFNTPPTPTTPYWISRIPVDDEDDD